MLDDETQDGDLKRVVAEIESVANREARFAKIFRQTYDQLYDGQHTGRFAWDQLYKTEKTHFGTLIEINIRREFSDLIGDGSSLDFKIGGVEIDCKYSFRFGGWMLPPESFGQLVLVCIADDAASEWSIGVVRATDENRRTSSNRDGKSTLSERGRQHIHWVDRGAYMPPNVLLQIDESTRAAVFAPRSGQQRVNQLFRLVTHRRIGRNAVATVAQQDDFMKRVRANGGARSALASEGIAIFGGDYESQRAAARSLNLEVPMPGEFVSARLTKASADDPFTAWLGGELWRVAEPSEPVIQAPVV